MDFASNSIGWLEQYRSDATERRKILQPRFPASDEAYSNETGVNLDEELTLLLDIEQSYKAATKILNAVDEMLEVIAGHRELSHEELFHFEFCHSECHAADDPPVAEPDGQGLERSHDGTVTPTSGYRLALNSAKSSNYTRELDRISSFKDSNSTVNLRLEMSQGGLSEMQKAGDRTCQQF